MRGFFAWVGRAVQGFFAWVGRALKGIFARPSTADLLTNDLFGGRLNQIRDGLSDPAAVMVVEWRIRAKKLRFFAATFLYSIIFALLLGLVLVWAAKFLVGVDIEAVGMAKDELFGKRQAKALEQLEQGEKDLEARRNEIITKMETLLRGGGENWHETATGTKATLWEMHFSDARTGWVIGDEGTILHTSDGHTWTKAETSTEATLWEMHFADAKTGWVIGDKGTILQTTNGETWTKANTETEAALWEMHFADAKTGWVIGDKGTILHTTDGKNWTKAETPTTEELIAIHFADTKNGWVVGRQGTILQTTDGKTWTKAETPTEATLLKMHFADAKTGWVIGDKGTILHTTDGETWTKAETSTEATLWEMHFADAKTGWVVGDKGTILHTTDGETWSKPETRTMALFWRIHFADAKTGWVIGSEGSILYTTDGKTWTKAATGTTAFLRRMHFTDAKTGWVIGHEGTILRTIDGEIWTKAETATTAHLRGIHFADARTGWVIGKKGIILVTRDYDITLADLTIGEQIDLAKKTALKDIFEKKGYLDDLEGVRKSLRENQQKRDAIKAIAAEFKTSMKPGDSKTESGSLAAGKLPDKTDEELSSGFLLQTSIIRITTILLIAFLVQILVSLYRYNTRLAGYYDARADAVLMTELAGMRFDKLVELLSPDHLAFGRQPRSPADNAIEMLRETLRSVRQP